MFYFSLLGGQRNTEGISWMIVFALYHILRAAVIEAEDLIVEVKARGIDSESLRQKVVCLSIDLQLSV